MFIIKVNDISLFVFKHKYYIRQICDLTLSCVTDRTTVAQWHGTGLQVESSSDQVLDMIYPNNSAH